MIYYVETMIDTSSTAHFRTFLKKNLRPGKGGGAKDDSGAMASRSAA